MEGGFQPGFICYGVPIGSDLYVRHKLMEKAEQVAVGGERSGKVLAGGTEVVHQATGGLLAPAALSP